MKILLAALALLLTASAARAQQITTGPGVQPLGHSSVSINTTGLTDKTLGSRAPLFIWTNPSNTSSAGQSASLQLWMGDNPTATPGANQNVPFTLAAINGNSRNVFWTADILAQVCNVSSCGADYNDSLVHGIEIETGSGYALTETDPWGSGAFRKNAMEFTAMAGYTGQFTSNIEMWANDTTGASWTRTGIAISRIAQTGLLFQSNPNGVSDGVSAFATAALYDNSNSAQVLKIGAGTHTGVIDLSGGGTFGNFVTGLTGAATTLPFRNAANFGMILAIDSGVSAAQASRLDFNDRGSNKWTAQKDSSNNFTLFNWGLSHNSLTIDPATDNVTLAGQATTTFVTINPTSTGGMQLGNTAADFFAGFGGSRAMIGYDATNSGFLALSVGTSKGISAYVGGTNASFKSGTLAMQIGSSGIATFGGVAAAGNNGELALTKIAASGSAPGAGYLKIAAVAGTNANTCKIIAYAGTSTTPVTVIDNVGTGC